MTYHDLDAEYGELVGRQHLTGSERRRLRRIRHKVRRRTLEKLSAPQPRRRHSGLFFSFDDFFRADGQ